MDELTFHELAGIFPLMEGAEFDALKADIAEHGQQEMIVTWNGAILDGRNRYNACRKLGIEPKTIEWSGVGSAQAFVISHNLHRRHLNASERAMIAGKLANRTLSEAGAIASAYAKAKRNGTEVEFPNTDSLSVKEAASLLKISKDSVVDAHRVLAEGTPEEIAAVSTGKASVYTVATQIRKKVSPAERLAKMSNPNQDRIHTMRANGKLWRTFKEAIVNLTSLPLPADVAHIVRAQDRQGLTDKKLLSALNYLQEFSDAWTNPDVDAEANSRRKNKSARKAGEAAAPEATAEG